VNFYYNLKTISVGGGTNNRSSGDSITLFIFAFVQLLVFGIIIVQSSALACFLRISIVFTSTVLPVLHGPCTFLLFFWPCSLLSLYNLSSLFFVFVCCVYFSLLLFYSTAREVSTEKAITAIRRLQDEAGCVIRSQAPVMRGINDDPEVWAEKWRAEVKHGIVPYYLFVARDTGARDFFDVPLYKAQQLYADAIRSTSGLCRTARGPSMSCTPGKVEVVGVQMVNDVPAFVLRFLQCRNADWIGRVFFAKYDEKAVWFDDLEPLEGMELPWTEEGLPKPVPGMPWKDAALAAP
jgi:hypothetical protein